MMRKELMPASRSLMPMQMPEKPAPTMSTSTLVTGEFMEEAAPEVMRGPSLPCSIPRPQRERGETRRYPGAIGAPFDDPHRKMCLEAGHGAFRFNTYKRYRTRE